MDIRCVGGRARCAVLVSHRCTVKARARRDAIIAAVVAQGVVLAIAVIIGMARA